MPLLAGILLLLPLTFWGCIRSIASFDFNQRIGGHIERAASAGTVGTAIMELETVLKVAKEKKLTEGSTAVFSAFATPDEDVGFWYENLEDSLGRLKAVPISATPSERAVVLLALRGTLLTGGEDPEPRVPPGISIHPRNSPFGAGLAICGVLALLGLCLLTVAWDDRKN